MYAAPLRVARTIPKICWATQLARGHHAAVRWCLRAHAQSNTLVELACGIFEEAQSLSATRTTAVYVKQRLKGALGLLLCIEHAVTVITLPRTILRVVRMARATKHGFAGNYEPMQAMPPAGHRGNDSTRA